MVDIKIHKRFIDGKILYAPGIWPVSPMDARRLHVAGKGRIVDKAMADALDNAIAATGGTVHDEPKGKSLPEQVREKDQKITSDKIITQTENDLYGATQLPEDFPERDVLIANGFDTIESLCQKDVDVKLAEIDGIGQGKVNKIALALNKFKKG